MKITKVRRPAHSTRTLVIMVKEPQAGRVKTRLAKDVGAVRAVAVFRHTLAAVISRVVRPARWRTLLAVAPDTARYSRTFPPHIDRVAQGRGDLGARMQRLMVQLPPGPVVIIGSDIPDVAARHIASAFAAIGPHDAVFGPAPDGGYWAVGLRRSPRVLCAFENVRWSSCHALADTRANLARLGTALIDELGDVDDAAALAKLRGSHGRYILPVNET